ncbi:MAG: TadE/TadG family type IV pilus assembly protein [Chloroflexota bacterium]
MQACRLNKQGQSLVEIALALPVLVILFLGMAEVGFFLFSHVQVANAARAGARYGTLCKMNANCDGGSEYANFTEVVESAVRAEAKMLNMNGGNSDVLVQPDPLPVMTGTPITVTVTYTHTPPFISQFVPVFPAEIPIRHTVIMHISN